MFIFFGREKTFQVLKQFMDNMNIDGNSDRMYVLNIGSREDLHNFPKLQQKQVTPLFKEQFESDFPFEIIN